MLQQLRPSARLAPGSALPMAILLALLGLASALAYLALDAGRAEALASQRELRGYAALASVQLARRLDAALEQDSGRTPVEAVRALLADPSSLLPPGPDGGGHPLWAELRAPDGRVVFRTPGWEQVAPLRGSWLEAKIGWDGVRGIPVGAVIDTLEGPLAGYATHVALRPGWRASSAEGTRPGSRLPLLMAVFVLTLALVGVAIVQLRRQQELYRLRDDFVSGVSHELRTPLAQIRLFADLLESGRLADAGQRGRSVRVIAEESRRLSYLVENILHFSRAERGALQLAPAAREVAPCLEETLEAFTPLATAAGCGVVLRAQPDVVARIDRDAFRQVLLNLLDNAVKYGPAGQVVAVDSRVNGGRLELRVTDRGPGIPSHERSTVWKPYRRLARHASVTGCGIGLSVVRHLVELHQGTVAIADAPGGGCSVTCSFPGAVVVAAGAPLPAAVA